MMMIKRSMSKNPTLSKMLITEYYYKIKFVCTIIISYDLCPVHQVHRNS